VLPLLTLFVDVRRDICVPRVGTAPGESECLAVSKTRIANGGLTFACRNDAGGSGRTRTSPASHMYGGTGACAKCSSLELLESIVSSGHGGGTSPDKLCPISIVGDRGCDLVDGP
jgi:hypothetical protein